MQEAWAMSEGRYSCGAGRSGRLDSRGPARAAGLVLIASSRLAAVQKPADSTRSTSEPGRRQDSVSLQQPILVSFSQPMTTRPPRARCRSRPATSVMYSWIKKQPHARGPARERETSPRTPSTKVTNRPWRTHAAGQPLATPQTITFVTSATGAAYADPEPRARHFRHAARRKCS